LTVIFCDTSAMAKLYVAEPESPRVRALLESEDSFQYPTFRQHTDGIWFTVTQGTGGSTDRIMFGKLEDVGVLAAGGSSRK